MMELKKLYPVILMFCVLVLHLPIFSQQESKTDEILPPENQIFEKSDSLAIPWRSSGCQHLKFRWRTPNCFIVKDYQYINMHLLTLYNPDGTVWYEFSVNSDDPRYFMKSKKAEFLPFAISSDEDIPHKLYLRLTGESPNWYQVEVNEKTQAIRYIFKHDGLWAKISWDRFLSEIEQFKFEQDECPPLLDKPKGKVIEEKGEMKFITYDFLKTDGDWAYVETWDASEKNHRGWIRWRDGRKMLIKPSFNLHYFSQN